MSIQEIQRLTRQLRKAQDQLKEKSRLIASLQNQSIMHSQLNRKWQRQRQFLNQQVKQLRRRQQQSKYEKQETENRYLNVLHKMEDEIEDRKKKYHKLQTKIQPLIDHDTVRLKILNEVQSIHFLELEQFKRKNNHLKDEILKLKRQNQLYKNQVENTKIDYEDKLRRAKNLISEKDKNDHFNTMSYEMCMEVQNRLRINYEQAKKQAQYYKDKYFNCQKRYQERITELEKQISLLNLRKARH